MQISLSPHAPIAWTTTKVQRALISSSSSGEKEPEDEEEEEDDVDEDDVDKDDEDVGGSVKLSGVFLAAVSGLFFTLCSVTVKMLPRIDPLEVFSHLVGRKPDQTACYM